MPIHLFENNKSYRFVIKDIPGRVRATVKGVSDRFVCLSWIEHEPDQGHTKRDFDQHGKGYIGMWVNIDNIDYAIAEL